MPSAGHRPRPLAQLLGDGANQTDNSETYAREQSYLRAHQKCYDDLPQMLAPQARAAIRRNCLEAELAPDPDDPRWTRNEQTYMESLRRKRPSWLASVADSEFLNAQPGPRSKNHVSS